MTMRVPSHSDNPLATLTAQPAKVAAPSDAGQGFPGLIQAAKARAGQDPVSQKPIPAVNAEVEEKAPTLTTPEAISLSASTINIKAGAKTVVPKTSISTDLDPDLDRTDDPEAETATDFPLIATNLPGPPITPTPYGPPSDGAALTAEAEGQDAIDVSGPATILASTKALNDPKAPVTSAAIVLDAPANLADAPAAQAPVPEMSDHPQDPMPMAKMVSEDTTAPQTVSGQQDTDAAIPLPAPADGTIDAPSQVAAQPTVTQSATASTALAGTQTNPLDLSKSNWTETLVARIEQSGESGDSDTLTLTLTPEKLGTLQIRLEQRDGLTHVHIVTASTEASRIVMDSQHKLADQMARAGLEMGNQSTTTDLSQNASQGGTNFGHGRDNGPALPLSAPSETDTSGPGLGLAPVPETARRPVHAVDLMA